MHRQWHIVLMALTAAKKMTVLRWKVNLIIHFYFIGSLHFWM